MRKILLLPVLSAAACSSAIDIDVTLIDPCNQDAVQMMQYLKLEPRGDGLVSEDLSTIVEVGSASSPPIKIPLSGDFHLVASGYTDDTFATVAGIGFSAKRDLTNEEDSVSVRVPFALVDNFYKTTRLDESGECTQMLTPRLGATATFLPDNGKVLIVGGMNLGMENGVPVLQYSRLIELYDPSTGSFVDAGELRSGGARAFHTATLLSDGRVLVAGGEAHVMLNKEALKSALIIDARDPGNVSVSDLAIMRQARTGHIATRLPDGRVLLAGGREIEPTAARPEDHHYLTSVEIFDPGTVSFVTPVDASNNIAELTTARYGHSGFALKSGFDVVIAGGMNSTGAVPSIEVLHIDGLTMTAYPSTGVQLGVGSIFHAADMTDDGEVMLSGGYGSIEEAEPNTGLPVNATAAVEIFAFDNTTFQMRKICATSMAAPRGFHTASIVGNTAIIIGGRGTDGVPQPSSETATVSPKEDMGTCFGRPPVLHNMTDARAQHSVAKMQNSGELLVIGGRQQDRAEQFGRSIDSAEVFSPRREP